MPLKRYLVRTEFGDYYQHDNLSDDMIEQCKDGIVDIVDTHEGKEMFTNGEWEPVEEWEEDSEND